MRLRVDSSLNQCTELACTIQKESHVTLYCHLVYFEVVSFSINASPLSATDVASRAALSLLPDTVPYPESLLHSAFSVFIQFLLL